MVLLADVVNDSKELVEEVSNVDAGNISLDTVEKIWTIASPIVWAILEVIIVFIVGKKVIKWIISIVKHATEKGGLDKGVSSFISSCLRVILYLILVVIIAGIVGIPTASFVAVLGSCGLAVGLALQGSLANFAGGVLILIMKPFLVGDYISVNGLEGTVMGIDICYTKLRTVDNRVVVLPNGALSNSSLTNVSREPKRRVDLVISIGYDNDIRGAKAVLASVASKCDLLLKDEPIDIYVSALADSAIELGLRVWCQTSDYWTVKWQMLEDVKYALEKEGFTIPFKQVDVHFDKETKTF